MTYWRLHYHVVWATRDRAASLTVAEADLVVRVVKESWADRGVIVHAVGPMPDHVHVAASIPPTLSVAEVVRRWKGSSSHLVNSARSNVDQPTEQFAWQAEYGVISFSQRALTEVVAYVENQSQRHRDQATWAGLERTDREQTADGTRR